MLLPHSEAETLPQNAPLCNRLTEVYRRLLRLKKTGTLHVELTLLSVVEGREWRNIFWKPVVFAPDRVPNSGKQ